MMARRGMLGLFGGAMAAMLGGCGMGDTRFRFKMEMAVDTPDGPRSAASVYEVKSFRQSDLVTGASGSGQILRGEALALDLPVGKTLFALIKTVHPQRLDLAAMAIAALDPAYARDSLASAKRIAAKQGVRSRATVSRSDYPMLVTFDDTADPASLRAVDPANLAASFGPGFAFRAITVATTDAPRTTCIETRLPWLRDVGRMRGSLIPNPPRLLKDSAPIQLVGLSDFSTELYR